MIRLQRIRSRFCSFFDSEDGVALTEALIVLPFLTFLAIAILEFGMLFWQREQMETGLRDAARYMARCRHATGCDTAARNLAYFGNSLGGTNPRVPGWTAANAPITFAIASGQVSARSTHNLANSPLFGALGLDTITITARHDQRVIGW